MKKIKKDEEKEMKDVTKQMINEEKKEQIKTCDIFED